MFDFNSWEFLALGIAAILIFGPERLPGMIRKAGEYYAQLQSVAASFRRELEAETSEITKPLKEAVADVSHVGQEIAAAGKDVGELAANTSTQGSYVSPEGEVTSDIEIDPDEAPTGSGSSVETTDPPAERPVT